MACFYYIAPVFPDIALSILENAVQQQGFATRSNSHFDIIVRLLFHLAYEDRHFDRALEMLLKFAETERKDENNNSIVRYLQQLFSMYLSGTEVLPARRQKFLERLLGSSNPRHREIASNLFYSALEAPSWSSCATFDFGARKRGYGWQPKNNKERLDWYFGFIGLLDIALRSDEIEQKNWAKKIVSFHFRALWTFAGCFDMLEQIVREHARGGTWPDLWIAIKSTIHFDEDEHEPTLLQRLKKLEKISAPHDLYSEIEAYAFTNTWEHADVRDGNRSDAVKPIEEKIIKLGELACAEPEYLNRPGRKLWEKDIDALCFFGKGLARGSSEQAATFEMLVKLVDKSEQEQVSSVLLQGFLHEVHEKTPYLAQQMLERILKERKLKEHFVSLLGVAPIEVWGAKKLIELAEGGELEAWRFTQINYGQLHKIISDEELTSLLEALVNLVEGIPPVIQILEERFFIAENSSYSPNESLLAVGRKAIRRMLTISGNKIQSLPSRRFKRVSEHCFTPTVPENEVSEIISLIYKGIKNFWFSGSEIEGLVSILIKNFPEIFLDHIFIGSSREERWVNRVFRDCMYILHRPSLNEIPVDRLLAWCNREQDKIQRIAKAVCVYSTVESGKRPMDNSKRVVLSNHIKALLNAADDKISIVEIIFDRISPSGWSGSLADSLEVRSHAFSELLEYPLENVRILAKNKLEQMQELIPKIRVREVEEGNKREQRFE